MTIAQGDHQLEVCRVELLRRVAACAEAETTAVALFDCHYLHSLITRSRDRSNSVATVLLNKAAAAVAELEAKAEKSEHEETAVTQVVNGASANRGSAPIGSIAGKQGLAELCHLLEGVEEESEVSGPLTIAQQLLSQEQIQFESERSDSGTHSASRPNRGNLRAAKNLNKLQSRYKLDQLIAAAAAARPESPGPLNPQRLVVQALGTMHDLSPAYLKRFISYSRTLLWLQRSGEKMEKKTGAGTRSR